jgi:AmmeMemoRadiSam system protein A
MKRGDQDRLLQIARDAILRHMEKREHPPIQGDREPESLMQERASFVTLSIEGQLRGCIGMLKACRPLIEDVAENARAAAFDDPRFPALQPEEFDQLEIHISVLSLPEELHFGSEAELLTQIRQGVDGLILRDGFHSGTFLPSVWAELPEKEQFLSHLKMKAGLPVDFWSDELRVFRYTAEYFPA